jgi:hypothetical protein
MMKMIKRLTALAVVTGAVMAATPAVAATPVGVTGAKPQAKVTILKPLTIAKKSDLDFGTILLPSTVSGTLNVKVDQAGVMTCGSGLTCATTAASVGAYTVTGTNKQLVKVTAPNVTMTNTVGAGSIVVTLDAPGTITLQSSGASSTDFPVGGSFNIDSSTVDGVYAGDMNVTVEYQ